jgi:hypothetical protein
MISPHQLTETGQSAKPQLLDAIQSAAHTVSDLGECQTLQVTQNENLAVVLWEFAEGVGQEHSLLAP